MKLYKKLRILREEKGKTQEEVANDLGIGITTLKNYERESSNRIPNTPELMKIKEYYNVSYDYLINDECENRTNTTISIGKELKLTDEVINIIKHLDDRKKYSFEVELEKDHPEIYLEYIKEKLEREKNEKSIELNSFNYFIETFYSLKDFLYLLNTLFALAQIYNDLDYFIHMIDLQTYFISVLSEKGIKGLIEIFDLLDMKINDIYDIQTNGDNNIEIDSDSAFELKEIYDNFKEYCKKYKKTSNKNKIINETIYTDVEFFQYLNDIFEISINYKNYVSKEIKYIKYDISTILTLYLNCLMDNEEDTMPKELQKFKNISSKIIKRKGVDKNGDSGTNKKQEI